MVGDAGLRCRSIVQQSGSLRQERAAAPATRHPATLDQASATTLTAPVGDVICYAALPVAHDRVDRAVALVERLAVLTCEDSGLYWAIQE